MTPPSIVAARPFPAGNVARLERGRRTSAEAGRQRFLAEQGYAYRIVDEGDV